MSARRHRTRSIITRLVVFLLLGAVVNVAVAWGFALWGGDSLIERRPPTEDDLLWAIRIGLERTDVHFVDRDGQIGVTRETLYQVPVRPKSTMSIPFANRIEAGFPIRSVAGEYGKDESLGSNKYYSKGMTFLGGLSIVPSAPIWPGFAINTFFYAAILWLLFTGPGSVRRWRRIRRGLCAKCAYPVGASEVCTECGAHINKKIKARGSMGLPPPATPVPGTTSESNA